MTAGIPLATSQQFGRASAPAKRRNWSTHGTPDRCSMTFSSISVKLARMNSRTSHEQDMNLRFFMFSSFRAPPLGSSLCVGHQKRDAAEEPAAPCLELRADGKTLLAGPSIPLGHARVMLGPCLASGLAVQLLERLRFLRTMRTIAVVPSSSPPRSFGR